MSRSGFAACAALAALSVAGIVPALHDRAERSSRALGSELGAWLPSAHEERKAAPSAPHGANGDARSVPPADAPPPSLKPAKRSPKKAAAGKAKARADAKALTDIFVDAKVVRSWAAKRMRPPSAAFVAAIPGRPAGLLLRGVERFGVGVRDGDVLTAVGGRSVSSQADVVSVVLGAFAAGQRAVTGQLYRGTKSFRVTVELPR